MGSTPLPPVCWGWGLRGELKAGAGLWGVHSSWFLRSNRLRKNLRPSPFPAQTQGNLSRKETEGAAGLCLIRTQCGHQRARAEGAWGLEPGGWGLGLGAPWVPEGGSCYTPSLFLNQL